MGFISLGGWYRGTYPVQIPFEIAVPAAQVTEVQAGIDLWNSESGQTGLELTPRTNESAFIRFVGVTTGACSSPVGMQPNQPQEVRCDLGAGFNRISVAHEIGHAIGMIHEHQRPDRDANILVTENVPGNGALNDLNIQTIPELIPINGNPFLPNGSITSVVGNYDCNSIMHYPLGTHFGADFALQAGGCATIGGATALSAGDIQTAQALYGGGGGVVFTPMRTTSRGRHLIDRGRARRRALRKRRRRRVNLRSRVQDFRAQNPGIPAGFYDNPFERDRKESGFPLFFGVEYEAKDTFVFWHF